MTVHVVQTGEDLWAISNKYNVPIESILNLNGLVSASVVVPGLALYLPDNLPHIRFYRIKAGDQIGNLAFQFHTDPASILAANPGIHPNQLRIGQIIHIPSPLKLQMAALGFIVPSSESANLTALNSVAGQLSYLAIVAYSFTDEGFAYRELEDAALVARSKQLNIKPLLMIRNFTSAGFSPDLAGRILENQQFRRNLVASILNLARQRGYGGVSIDFEFIPPERRRDFISFLTELKRGLGDLVLHVNVHAKTEDIPTNRIIGAYDYAAIGRVADMVAVMTIDYGYPGGPPDPIAPITWLEQVIQYSITQIPPRKLQMAIALYGYDKAVRTNATKAMSVLAAQNRAISTGSPIQIDLFAKSPWYRYWRGVEERIVWFEDIRSLIEKYRLLDIYQLAGTTFWQITLPFPQNWAYIRDHIAIIKT
ncbi:MULTISPECIES: glycosyl hydrolase family 18 protein [Neobacillus]|uniref:LysM peptidoglycan-binding domain-containing protein n=1 Tax=Neobacillus rhizophilus TaxID=2833579 RepID=A0A942UAB8_9BACI|nr:MULTISPECIES: glycosyl hydrolase family 18 protein [Neobacillus]MBS4216470.1 LysM peptidoglycan-binding domain-containing protein [Neobacillus rhizophilus]